MSLLERTAGASIILHGTKIFPVLIDTYSLFHSYTGVCVWLYLVLCSTKVPMSTFEEVQKHDDERIKFLRDNGGLIR